MPQAAPRLCSCGYKIASGQRCPCQVKRDQARKARFDETRPTAAQRGYDARWQRYTKDFLAKNPTCARCSSPSTVVDHIMAHKGNKILFWNPANHQALCTPCHSSWKQRQERQS